MNNDVDLDICKQHSDHGEGFELLYEKIREKAKVLNNSPFIEIGTREGGSALVFLNAIRGTNNLLITVDPYGKHYEAGGEWPPIGDAMYRTAQFILSSFAYHHHLLHIPFRITSESFMNLWDKSLIWINGMVILKNFGVVYLDGEHTEEMVMKEIDWFLPKMDINGLLIIDDVSYLKDTKVTYLKELLKAGLKDSNRLYISTLEAKKIWPSDARRDNE